MKVIIPQVISEREMPGGVFFPLPKDEYLAQVQVDFCGKGNLRDSDLTERINKTLEFEFGSIFNQKKYGIPLNHDVEVLGYREVGRRDMHPSGGGIEIGLRLEVHYRFRASEEQE